jgi:NAD-dependent dihydropyrimidine dehydrogenase PreA subunit
MKGYSYLQGVVTLQLDKESCIGCGLCVEACPHGVFGVADRKAFFREIDACIECGACALNCPVKAITVDAGVGCAAGMINEWINGLGIRKKLPGCC